MQLKNKCAIGFFLLLGAVMFVGCEKPKPMRCTEAVVDVTVDPTGRLVKVKKTLTDAKEVDRLASFFPHFGEGRKSSTAGLWQGFASVKFTGSDGRVVTVHTNYEWWTEGSGDWPMDTEFTKYVMSILESIRAQSRPDGDARPASKPSPY
jgi:hypothetical protein